MGRCHQSSVAAGASHAHARPPEHHPLLQLLLPLHGHQRHQPKVTSAPTRPAVAPPFRISQATGSSSSRFPQCANSSTYIHTYYVLCCAELVWVIKSHRRGHSGAHAHTLNRRLWALSTLHCTALHWTEEEEAEEEEEEEQRTQTWPVLGQQRQPEHHPRSRPPGRCPHARSPLDKHSIVVVVHYVI